MQPERPRSCLIVGNDEEVFATVAKILDPDGWELQRAPSNEAARIAAQATAFELIITNEATPAREDVQLLRAIRRLHPHTRMIILTDESTPADVIESMRQHAFSYFVRPYSHAALADAIRGAIDAPIWDDGIEVVSSKPEWLRFRVRADRDTAERLVQFVREISDLPEAEREAVCTAFRELLLNAIEHGARFDPNQSVDVSYLRTKRMVACQITDPGEGFTPDNVPHAAISNPPEDPIRHVLHREEEGLRPGGYGVLLARELVDDVIYGEKGNEVTLVKYLDDTAQTA